MLDDGRPVDAIHHKGEHLPSGAHGPLVTGRRDHGGPGNPLGPAPLHWCWPDPQGEGHLQRWGGLLRLLCGRRWLWSWPRYRATHPWGGDLQGQRRESEEVPISWGWSPPLSHPYNCCPRAQLLSHFPKEAPPPPPARPSPSLGWQAPLWVTLHHHTTSSWGQPSCGRKGHRHHPV